MSTRHRTLSVTEQEDEVKLKNVFRQAWSSAKTARGEAAQTAQAFLRKARSKLADYFMNRMIDAARARIHAEVAGDAGAAEQAQAKLTAELRDLYNLFAFDLQPGMGPGKEAQLREQFSETLKAHRSTQRYGSEEDKEAREEEFESAKEELLEYLQHARTGTNNLVQYFGHKNRLYLQQAARSHLIILANAIDDLEERNTVTKAASEPAFLAQASTAMLRQDTQH
ncbi:hypothetical protein JCM8547_005067 [Rhodosporidiobolus lusitaniae]